MSAAMLMQAWGDTLVTTAILVLAVLLIRKPFARHFGPRLAYALWLVPALRLVLPPLPFADPVAAPPSAAPVWVATDTALAHPAAAAIPGPVAADWSLATFAPWLFAAWCVGAAVVLIGAMTAHRRFRRTVLTGAVELEPIGSIRLVMSDGVDGPVAFGLWRRHVAVPRDFFARYAAEERALAIDHELAHHRHGDLWANAAALLLLAAQWFNPLAWRAIRAFRFDQEAACDARVLALESRDAAAAPRDARTACYATAIAKAAVGARLSLAAPMAVHDNLQERLTMLTQKEVSKGRGLIGRLMVGGATLAVLATTATLVPSGIAVAQPAPPAPPAAPDVPPPPPAPPAPPTEGGQRIMIVATGAQGAGDTTTITTDGGKREVHRMVIRRSGEGDGPGADLMLAPTEGAPGARRMQIRLPGGLSREDVLATLKEQGVTGAKAEAIADRLEAKRKERLAAAMPPMPPVPPMPPMPAGAWAPGQGKAMAFANCRGGQKPTPLVNSDGGDGKARSHVMLMSCGDGADNRGARLAALKKARERFARDDVAAMSAETRAKVLADIDRAIADAEKAGK